MSKSAVIMAAVYIGLVHLLPLALLYKHTPIDRVFYPFSFSELLYGAQVKEILEGHIAVGDPQFYEHKQTFPSIFPYVPVFILAILSKLSGSIVNGFFLSDGLFPFIICLILYGFGTLLTGNKAHGIFASLATIVFYPLLTKLPPASLEKLVRIIKQLFLFEIPDRLPFYRTPNPQISFIFLVLALWCLYSWWNKPTSIKFCLSIFLGIILFSVYFYHITYFLAFVIALLLFSILTKNPRTLSLMIILSTLLFNGLFYYWITNGETYRSLLITGGKFSTRAIDWLYSLRYAAALLCIWFFLRKSKIKAKPFLLILPLAGIIVMNIQVITGWSMQPGHWPQTTIEPLLAFALSISLGEFFKISRRRILYPVLLFFILIYALGYQTLHYQYSQNTWSIPRDLNNILVWLNTKVPAQSVVVSLDIETLAYIPVLTSANIFLPVEEFHYATIDEIWDRILYAYNLYQVPVEQFDPHRLALPAFFELTYNVNQFKHFEFSEYASEMVSRIKNCYPTVCSGLYALPKSLSRDIKHRYANINSQTNPYRADYAIFSDREKKLGAVAPAGELVFVSGDYQIYLLNPVKSGNL